MNRLSIVSIVSASLAIAACSSSSTSSSSEDGGPSEADAGAVTGGDASAGGTGDSGAPRDSGGASDTGTPANGADAKVVLAIPSSFSGATRQLDVVVTPTLPIAGPPSAVLYQSTSAPTVNAGQPLEVHGDASSANGDLYVVVVLYMQGGGQFSPKNGVDYVGYSTQKVHFSEKAIDLGTIPLVLAGDDGGP